MVILLSLTHFLGASVAAAVKNQAVTLATSSGETFMTSSPGTGAEAPCSSVACPARKEGGRDGGTKRRAFLDTMGCKQELLLSIPYFATPSATSTLPRQGGFGVHHCLALPSYSYRSNAEARAHGGRGRNPRAKCKLNKKSVLDKPCYPWGTRN